MVNKAHRGKAGGDPISVDIYSGSEFLAAKFGPVWGRTHSGFNYLSHLAFNHVWHQTGDLRAWSKQKSKPITCNWHDCLAALVLCFSEVSSPSELLLISIPADVVSSLKNGGSV